MVRFGFEGRSSHAVEVLCGKTELGENLFVGDGFVILEPSLGSGYGALLFLADLLILERRVGDGAATGSSMIFNRLTTTETWPGAMRSISSYACCFVSVEATAILSPHGNLPWLNLSVVDFVTVKAPKSHKDQQGSAGKR